MNQNMRIKVWLALLGVFVLGCLTGASLDSLYRLNGFHAHSEAHSADDKGSMFEELRRNLNLNDQQVQQVGAILDETRNEFRQLRGDVRPRYDAVRQKARERIRAVLNPEQQKLFDTITAERDARRRSKDE